MGEIAAQFIKIAVRLAFILAGILAFVILVNFALQLVFITLNQSVLHDLIVLVQIWLPFNLDAITGWILVASALYLTYRLTVSAIQYVSRLTGA